MAGRGFSVDDAFESDEDEKIRTYGSTTATKAFRGAGKQEKTKEQHEEQSISESGGLLETSPDSPSAKLDLSRLSFADTVTTDDASISVKTFSGNVIWYRHPKVRDNWKIVLASFVLLLIGLGLIVAGIVIEVSHTSAVQSFVFFIAGGICFIPGAYHVVYIYCAVKGRRGFSFHNLPTLK